MTTKATPITGGRLRAKTQASGFPVIGIYIHFSKKKKNSLSFESTKNIAKR